MKYAGTAIIGYVVGWTASYVYFMGMNFKFFFRYLLLAWTNPGELPTFINLGAVAMMACALLLLWTYGRYSKGSGRNDGAGNGPL